MHYSQHGHEQVMNPASSLQPAPNDTSTGQQFLGYGLYRPPGETADNPMTPADTLVDLQASTSGIGARVPRPLVFASLREAREHRRRVTQPPELHPEHDPTIAEVERDSPIWIKKLVEAMYNLEDVGDKPNAMHKTFFTPGHRNEYSYKDIEAACYELHTAVISRSRYGYRGPKQDDKAYKKGSKKVKKNPADEQVPNSEIFEVDCTGNCATRIQNVVDGLWMWKNSCAQVIYDDRQQRMMANHPYTFANNKGHNKKCNTKKAATVEAGKQAVAKLAKAEQNQEQAKVSNPAKKARTTRKKQPTPGFPSTPCVPRTVGHRYRTAPFNLDPHLLNLQNGQNLFTQHQSNDATHSHGYFDPDYHANTVPSHPTPGAERIHDFVHQTLTDEFAPQPPTTRNPINVDADTGNGYFQFGPRQNATVHEDCFGGPSMTLSSTQYGIAAGGARPAYNVGYGGQVNTYNLHHANTPRMSFQMSDAIGMPNSMHQTHHANERAPSVPAGLRNVSVAPVSIQSRLNYENGGHFDTTIYGGYKPVQTAGPANDVEGYKQRAQAPTQIPGPTNGKRKRENEAWKENQTKLASSVHLVKIERR